jgi:SAM-dependent methyltransferase
VTSYSAIERALSTMGTSADVLYTSVADALRRRHAGGLLVDVGCGVGRFRDFARDITSDYIGVDLVRHPHLAADVTFFHADLDRDPIPVPSACAGVVSAIETIEHLENPRAFMRELVRVLSPGGWLVVTTPNQLSARSLLSLLTRGQFAAFHGDSYPAHLTALLPIDLEHIAAECALEAVDLHWTCRGRIPLMALYYPRPLARVFPRAPSDHVLLVARKPD